MRPGLPALSGSLARFPAASGFTLAFPDTLLEVLGFQMGGDFNMESSLRFYLACMTGAILYGYMIYRFWRERKNPVAKLPIRALELYACVIGATLVASIITPVLYARYLFAITGLLIFALSYLLATEKKRLVAVSLCVLLTAFSVLNTINLIQSDYGKGNMTQIEYLQDNMQPEDILLYSNIGIGSVIATYFEDNVQYFYNPDDWGVEEAYEAYAPQMSTVTDLSGLDGYTGRIWLIDSENLGLYYDDFQGECYTLVSIQKFDTAYQNYIYEYCFG